MIKIKYASNGSGVKVHYTNSYTRNIAFGFGEGGFGDTKSFKLLDQLLHPP